MKMSCKKTESVYEFRNAIKTGKVSDKNMMSDKKENQAWQNWHK